MTTTQEVKVGQVWKNDNLVYRILGFNDEMRVLHELQGDDGEWLPRQPCKADYFYSYCTLVSPAPAAEFVPTYWALRINHGYRYRLDGPPDKDGLIPLSVNRWGTWQGGFYFTESDFKNCIQTDAHGTPLVQKQEQLDNPIGKDNPALREQVDGDRQKHPPEVRPATQADAERLGLSGEKWRSTAPFHLDMVKIALPSDIAAMAAEQERRYGNPQGDMHDRLTGRME